VIIGAVSASTASADPAGAQSDLVAVTGQGSGLVIVSPTNHDGGAFDARVTVNIHDAAPNTTFAVTRTADGLANGVCTGTVFAQVGCSLRRLAEPGQSSSIARVLCSRST
jgi:hypothetical protein